MTSLADARRLLADVDHAGWCSHPVRLYGRTVQRLTGEVTEGTITVACKDRRAVLCPACSALYKADAWHLVAAGLRGGKGVPVTVSAHPRLFVTLTAPSFGPVHTRPRSPKPGLCHPRRGEPVCSHGQPLDCRRRHPATDPVVGEPLCAECFDYEAAVLWNAHASALWRRTTIELVRTLASLAGMSEAQVRREARLSFVKVAELQRRGLVHLHLVLRGDGPTGPNSPPPPWLDADLLTHAVQQVVGTVSVPGLVDSNRMAWGSQLDIRVLSTDDPDMVAAYVAKYATKATDDSGALARRLGSLDDLQGRQVRPHAARLATTAWKLGANPALAGLRLRAHAHTFGFPGHLTTKSRAYSTTFAALRGARRERVAAKSGSEPLGDGWQYVGRGYADGSAADLADALVAARATLPRSFPSGSPTDPHPADQGERSERISLRGTNREPAGELSGEGRLSK